jgi:hypothetical protein
VKILSGEPQWRHLTAMVHYYENGPLPDWIGWYAQQLPHGFHASVALLTLLIELGLVWMMFFPRRFRIVCFLIVTPFQVGIILTANLAFLNYFVLALGILLLDDGFLRGAVRRIGDWRSATTNLSGEASLALRTDVGTQQAVFPAASYRSLILPVIFLTWIFYATTVLLLLMLFPGLHLPLEPVRVLEPFRIADRYGLFAVMTRARYEIEFQGSRDGQTWIAYPFRYKPQDPRLPPRIHAPYQPRFDWNLWFASLGTWRENTFVLRTEERLLLNSPSVLSLFAGNPFPGDPPRQVRAVRWQYSFTDLETKRAQGVWWRRDLLGLYAPTLEREPDGKIVVVTWPK